MKAKVLAMLVKRGYNEKDAAAMVEKNLDAAVSCYPDASVSRLAEIVAVFG